MAQLAVTVPICVTSAISAPWGRGEVAGTLPRGPAEDPLPSPCRGAERPVRPGALLAHLRGRRGRVHHPRAAPAARSPEYLGYVVEGRQRAGDLPAASRQQVSLKP